MSAQKKEKPPVAKWLDVIKQTRGKIFRITFVKKDGSERTLIGRTGVKKYVNGTGMSYDPIEHDLIPVYDTQKEGYRMIRLKTIREFSCGDSIFRVGAKGQPVKA